MAQVVQVGNSARFRKTSDFKTHVIPSEDAIDPDVFRHMNSLGCFKDKQKLISELLSTR